MTTGYSREQLAELYRQIYESAPLEVTNADRKLAPKVLDTSMAATELGVLLRLGFKRGEERDFFLNCAVLIEFAFALYGAGETYGWWLKEYDDPAGFSLEAPTPSDLGTAANVISLRTDFNAKGVLVAFRIGLAIVPFYMCRKLVEEILGTIQHVNDRARWWDESMALIPNDGTSRNE
jgi:hypothetical protein